jgi:hypothetical protein
VIFLIFAFEHIHSLLDTFVLFSGLHRAIMAQVRRCGVVETPHGLEQNILVPHVVEAFIDDDTCPVLANEPKGATHEERKGMGEVLRIKVSGGVSIKLAYGVHCVVSCPDKRMWLRSIPIVVERILRGEWFELSPEGSDTRWRLATLVGTLAL